MTRRQLLRLGGLAPIAPRALLAAAPAAGTYSNLLPALPYSKAAVMALAARIRIVRSEGFLIPLSVEHWTHFRGNAP
jgi:hypothetical protein